MKKIFISILLCSLCLFAGCNSSGDISTFTIEVEEFPSVFDPQTAYKSGDLLVITNIFDGLFEKEGENIVTNLAESWDVSGDGRTYTIKLKEDRVYHYTADKERAKIYNEAPVTARDFVFALQRVLSPNTHSPRADNFVNIKNASKVLAGASPSILGVSAPDDRTLVIELESRDYNFIDKLCLPASFPCNRKFFDSCGGAYGLSVENILSNGAFRLNYLDEEDENATLVRADDIENSVERVRIYTATVEEQAQAYRDGDIDGYFDSTGTERKYSDTTLNSFESANHCLVINKTKGFLANLDARKAIGWYAFGFINSGANMEAVKSRTSIFPSDMTFSGEFADEILAYSSPSYLSQDPVSLIKNTGGARAGGEGLTLLIPRDSEYKVIYENINQLWQRDLGVFFKTEYLPVSEIRERVTDKNYDIAFLPLVPSDDTPFGVLGYFEGIDGDLDSTLARARSATDDTRAAEEIRRAQRAIIENVYAVPMGSEETIFYCRNYFEGIIIDPFNRIVNLKRAVSD